MADTPSDPHAIVYYDDDCPLCNWAVARCLQRGVPPGVRFASQQSARFASLAGRRLELKAADSIVIDDGIRTYLRSDAVLWLLGRLRGPERRLAALRFVPRVVRDAAYRAVARNRRAIGRRLRECPLPAPDQRRYFLSG